jgi:hypothetical protein
MREATPPPTLSAFHSELMVGLELVERGAVRIRRALDTRDPVLLWQGRDDIAAGLRAFANAFERYRNQLRAVPGSEPVVFLAEGVH